MIAVLALLLFICVVYIVYQGVQRYGNSGLNNAGVTVLFCAHGFYMDAAVNSVCWWLL